MRIIPYTAICGDYDEPRTDILCFTEGRSFLNPVRQAKLYKVLPWHFIDADISIWVDGNIMLRESPEDTVAQLLPKNRDMALFYHWRMDLYEEGAVCFDMALDDRAVITKQMKDYRERYGDVPGLWSGGVLIRRHNERVRKLCETWWSEISAHSHRDQLSFPVAALLNPECRIHTIGEPWITANPLFEYRSHRWK